MGKFKKTIALLLVFSMLIPGLAQAVSIYSEDSNVERLSGANRFATAVAISKDLSKEGYVKSKVAIIARADKIDDPDALSGGPLAAIKDAPILYTRTDKLDPATVAELKRLGVEEVILLGGKAVISGEVETQLKRSYQVERIGGENRYQTAALVGKKLVDLSSEKTAVLVKSRSGQDTADALTAGAYAGLKGYPILFTRTETLSDETKEALEKMAINKVMIVGGEAVVNKTIENQLKKQYIVERIAGANRAATSVEVAKKLFKGNTKVIIANGYKTADALAGSVLGAKLNAPILLVKDKEMKKLVEEYLVNKTLEKAYILGGEAVVNKTIKATVEDRLRAESYSLKVGINNIDRKVVIKAEKVNGNVDIKYTPEADLVLPEGLKIDGDLTVDAANATVINHAEVTGLITIKNVAKDTWIERANGNSLLLRAARRLILMGRARGITLDAEDATLIVDDEADLDEDMNLEINQNARVVSRRNLKAKIANGVRVRVRNDEGDSEEDEVIGDGTEERYLRTPETPPSGGGVPVTPPAYASTKALTNATVTVANGTSEADAKTALDATVGVVGTKGETGTANIAWTIASYDGNTANNYTATGVLTLPTGWTGTVADVTATVTVNPVTPIAYASTKKLTNATVTVDNGTIEADAKTALDKTVGVVGTKGETGTANIAWTIASYNGSTLGEYPATGVLTLPTGWTGAAGNVTATVRVTKANVPSSMTVGSSILNSTKPYLVDGKPATTGTLGADKCIAHFDSLTGVLSLQDYVGGEIRINEAGKDLRIKLIGNENKITGGQFGIHNDKGDIHVTSDSVALLEIEIKSSYDGAAIANGWSAMTENPSVFIGGKVKLTIKAEYTGAQNTNSITGIYAGKGSVTIQGQADYSATLTNPKYQGRGIYSSQKTIINTSGKIEIDVSNSVQGVGIYGMGGIKIQQVNSMLITIPSTGESGNTKFTNGTVDLSSGVAVNKSATKASYRSGTPYTLGLEGGDITSATGGVIGSPHQYLVDDEITIESTISEFDRWTKANGAALETSLFTGGATANSATATIKMPAGSLNIKAKQKDTGTIIDIAAIEGVIVPVTGATPVTKITDTAQYTGTVTWSPIATKFAGKTAYTATITLEAKSGFKLDGVAANCFTVEGATTVTNEADTGEIIAVFPATEADTLIDIAAIPGVVAPVTGKTPVTEINDTVQYTGTVAWTPANNPFAAETAYTATITLEAKPGFKLDGVAANFFTVEGATTTNTADSGVVTAVFPATAASDFAAGSGTVGDPYQVSSAEELNKVRNHPGNKVYFKQTEDIDLTAYLASGGAGYNEGKGWVPIGSSESSPFTGNYDGSGYTITGLTIVSTEDYQGLFGCGKQYTNLKNIKLLGINIKGKSYVGGLIGDFGFGQLENCHVSGKVEGTEDFVGGLAGLYNNGEGMKNCSTSVEVIGNKYVGGLAGKSGWTTIDSCYSKGSVTGVDIVGGLVGSVDSGPEVKVTNSYSLASVKATTNGRVGGLVGLNQKAIINCYAAGKVTGNGTDVGGLVGKNLGTITTITSSYYDSTITTQSDEGKGVRKTTSEMKQAATFVGWDFTNIWKFEAGSYPTLK